MALGNAVQVDYVHFIWAKTASWYVHTPGEYMLSIPKQIKNPLGQQNTWI